MIGFVVVQEIKVNELAKPVESFVEISKPVGAVTVTVEPLIKVLAFIAKVVVPELEP